MSLTIISGKPASRVRIGGEFDKDGQRGFVLLEVSPSPCLLTRKTAREVARAVLRFAENVRPVSVKTRRPPNYKIRPERTTRTKGTHMPIMTPDQFEAFMARLAERKAEILKLAQQGFERPKEDTKLGAFLNRCIDADDENYDPDFEGQLMQLAPRSWRMDVPTGRDHPVMLVWELTPGGLVPSSRE